ncbi:integral membrane protein [Aspergillus niger]|nr:integral membrane protein [Aspergillus niger]
MGWVHHASPEVEAESQYRLILGVCLGLTLLMIITVCLRLAIRFNARRLEASDFVMLVTMIFSIIYSALCVAQSRYGLGLPLSLRPKADLPDYTKLNYAGRPFYQLGIAGFKASLCLNYLRLISGTSKNFYRILIWAVIAVSTLGHLAGTLVLIFDCQPVERAWNPNISGSCLPAGPTFYGLAIFTIICDITIIILPIPLLLQLNIKTAQKAGVVCLFLLGLFTTICSILRLTQIHRVAYGDGNSTMLVLWGTIEFNVGNIVTCVPFLAPLLKGAVRDFRSYSGRKGYDSRSYALQTWSKDPRSQLRSTTSAAPQPKRTPSEELILESGGVDEGGIHMTVELRVSLEKRPTTEDQIRPGSYWVDVTDTSQWSRAEQARPTVPDGIFPAIKPSSIQEESCASRETLMVVHPDGQPRAATELCPAHASWPVGSGRCAKYLLERWHHYQYGSDPLRTDSDRLTPEK